MLQLDIKSLQPTITPFHNQQNNMFKLDPESQEDFLNLKPNNMESSNSLSRQDEDKRYIEEKIKKRQERLMSLPKPSPIYPTNEPVSFSDIFKIGTYKPIQYKQWRNGEMVPFATNFVHEFRTEQNIDRFITLTEREKEIHIEKKALKEELEKYITDKGKQEDYCNLTDACDSKALKHKNFGRILDKTENIEWKIKKLEGEEKKALIEKVKIKKYCLLCA